MAKNDTQVSDPFADQSSGDPFDEIMEMDDSVVDLENVSTETVFELVPAAKYPGWMKTAEYGPTKAGDKRKFVFKAKMRSLESPEDKFVHLSKTITLTEIGMSQLKRTIQNIGMDLPMRFDPSTLGPAIEGRPVTLDVELYIYDGQKRNRIANILPPTEDMAFLDS